MLILAVMCFGIGIGYVWVCRLPARFHRANSFLQMGCTLFLVFSMGALLGQRERFWQELSELGLSSLLLAFLPMAFSVAFVYLFTARPAVRLRRAAEAADMAGAAEAEESDALKGPEQQEEAEEIEEAEEVEEACGTARPAGGAERAGKTERAEGAGKAGAPRKEKAAGRDWTALFVILALACGVCGGQTLPEGLLQAVEGCSDGILYVLMFTVGVSVGANRVVIRKLREMDLRACLTPAGVMLGSLAGGALCSLFTRFSVWESAGIGAGMGWYSLSGVLLGDLYGPDAGAAAFLSNLMREFFTFLLAPAVMKRLNSFSGVAMAGATSEDTTLPILMRGSSEEVAVYAVINGVLTSAAVPVLIRAVAALSGAAG